MKRKIVGLIFVLLTSLLPGCASAAPVEVTREVEVTRMVEVTPQSWADPFSENGMNSEIIIETMQTEAFEETFRLYIWLPNSYESEPDENYPVLYLMDGNFDTRLASLLISILNFEESVPELIIVGVGYDTNESEVLNDLRIRDLFPVGFSEGYGRADELLAFMQNELIPHIDTVYRTLPEERYLAGFSAGGTFALYSMFHAPELYKGIIASSPALSIADWSVFEEADAYAENHTDLPVNLFISAESSAPTLLFERFATKLNEYGYENFKMKLMIMEDETHLTMLAVGFQKGMREIMRAQLWN